MGLAAILSLTGRPRHVGRQATVSRAAIACVRDDRFHCRKHDHARRNEHREIGAIAACRDDVRLANRAGLFPVHGDTPFRRRKQRLDRQVAAAEFGENTVPAPIRQTSAVNTVTINGMLLQYSVS